MYSKNLKEHFKSIDVIIPFGFILFILLLTLISILESFTYSGFFVKHFHFEWQPFIYILLLSGIFVSLFSIFIRKNYKQNKLFTLILLINIFLFTALLIVTLIFNLLELKSYPNFIYSNFHLQPFLLYKPVLLCGYSLLVLTIYLKGLKTFISNMPIFIYYIFAISLFIFTISNSSTFINNIYKIDVGFKQNNEVKYALGQINIVQWINESFPITKNIVFWCDKQTEPVEIFTLDPQIIWYTYEGLSRIFLTNCYYGGYGNIKNVEQKKDNLLIVSAATCDKKLEDVKGDPGGKIEEYLKIVNNNYVCNSSEITPGLYLYKGDKN